MKVIKYQFVTEHNHGTEEEPNIKRIYHSKEIRCSNEYFEPNYAIAQREACGEITGKDIPDEDTPPTQLDRVEAQATYTAMITDTLLEV